MSLTVDWYYLPSFLSEPVYLLPEPKSPPVFEAPLVAEPPPHLPSLPKSADSQPVPAPQLSQHTVAILYNEQTTSYLQASHETLLKNILKAINLSLAEVDLLNLHTIKRTDYVAILRGKRLRYFISFGIDLWELELPIPLTAYRVTEVEGLRLLLADSFHELELNLDKKRMLWTCLKQMFM